MAHQSHLDHDAQHSSVDNMSLLEIRTIGILVGVHSPTCDRARLPRLAATKRVAGFRGRLSECTKYINERRKDVQVMNELAQSTFGDCQAIPRETLWYQADG